MGISSGGTPRLRHTSGLNRNPQLEVTETVASYEQDAVQYATLWSNLRLERALDAFARRLDAPRRVLDLGCGPGRDMDHLTQLGCRVVGLDLSPRMLDEARRRLPLSSLILADLSASPLSPRSFEGVWACASLLHLPRCQLPLALAEIARLLQQPDGVLFLALKRGHGERWQAASDGSRRFYTFYRFPELGTVLHQAGFQIVEDWTDPDQAGRGRSWINLVARLRE